MANIKFNGIKPLQRLGDQALGLAFSNPLYNLTLMGKASRLKTLPPDPWPGDMENGHAILTGNYAFAGQLVTSDSVLWEPSGVTDDWIKEFHGFGWLRDLRSIGGDKARLKARHLVSDWMVSYDRWHKMVWRPDIMGERLSNWVGFYGFFGASADDDFQARFADSISRQLKHLDRVMPGVYSGIALIRGLKGLVYANLALNRESAELEKAFRLILDECKTQILPDGGHVSRSPAQQLEMLGHLIDLRGALNAGGLDVPGALQHAIDKMAPALKFFRYGDGDLAMFHGARSVNPMLCDRVLTQSGVKGRSLKSMPHSGYERLIKGKTLVMFDVGQPNSDQFGTNQGHISPLAFEMSVGRERLIVNCGGSPMTGAWQQALSCSAAHSTLTVEDKNPIFLDDNKPSLVMREESDDAGLLEGEHGGYKNLSALTHRRRLYISEHGDSLTGEDCLSGDHSGTEYAVRFHLHPSVQVSLIREGAEALLRTQSGMGWRMRFSGDVSLSLDESIYYADGTEPRRTFQLVLSGLTTTKETLIKWRFHKESFYN